MWVTLVQVLVMVAMVLAMCTVVVFALVVRATGTLTRLVHTVQRMNLLMKAGVNTVIEGLISTLFGEVECW